LAHAVVTLCVDATTHKLVLGSSLLQVTKYQVTFATYM